MLKDLLYKTGALVKFNFKKDLIYVSIWLITLIVFTFVVAQYYVNAPMQEAELNMLLETMKSPAMILIVGPAPEAVVSSSLMFSIEMTLFTVIIVSIMNIFLVTRNTRQDEESGRLELIRSLPTGRLSTLAASCIEAFIVNLLLAIGLSLSLAFVPFGEQTIAGGILFGAIMGASGFMIAGITAIFAQIFQSNRTVIMACMSYLGINFIFRGITDISYPSLSWLSPLSWCYKAEVYVNNYWIPVVFMILTGTLTYILALYLNSIRDLDGSFIKQKPGKTYASKSLVKPFGLVSRLSKATFWGWFVGIIVLGLTFGAIFGDLEKFFEGNEMLQLMFPDTAGNAFMKQFMGLTGSIFAICITIPVLTFIGRVISEEKKNYMENIISKAISRKKIFGTYCIYSLITSIVFIIFSIASLYGAGYTSLNFIDIFQAVVVFIPSIWFMVGLGIFLVGLIPKMFGIVWFITGYGFFITYFSGMLKMSKWLKSISPFYHIPLLPAEELKILPLIILTGLGIVLALLGFKAYCKRDITP